MLPKNNALCLALLSELYCSEPTTLMSHVLELSASIESFGISFTYLLKLQILSCLL